MSSSIRMNSFLIMRRMTCLRLRPEATNSPSETGRTVSFRCREDGREGGRSPTRGAVQLNSDFWKLLMIRRAGNKRRGERPRRRKQERSENRELRQNDGKYLHTDCAVQRSKQNLYFPHHFVVFKRADKWNILPKIWKTFGRQVCQACLSGLIITLFLAWPRTVAFKRSRFRNVQPPKSGN